MTESPELTENQIEEIKDEIKYLLPTVVKYMEKNGYDDFDYGYLYNLDSWECDFFDEEGNNTERFVARNISDLLKQLS